MYILYSVNIVIWTYVLILCIKSFTWHKEIKGIRFSHNERRKFYANYIGYIFLGNDSFIDNR